MNLDHLDNVPLVYFVQAETTGPIKIGKSTAMCRRYEALQGGSPCTLKLLGVVVTATPYALGKKLHKRFRSLHIHHEWFSPSRPLLNYIEKHAIDPAAVELPEPDEEYADPEGWLTQPIEYREPRPLTTLQELARELRISEATLARYVQAGTIPCLRVGHQIRFCLPAIYQYLQKISPMVEVIKKKYGMDPFVPTDMPLPKVVYSFLDSLHDVEDTENA